MNKFSDNFFETLDKKPENDSKDESNRLTNEDIRILLDYIKEKQQWSAKFQKFKYTCPYRQDETCGNEYPPSYCEKCFDNGKYNIKNGRFSSAYCPETGECKDYADIIKEHNALLVNTCNLNKGKETCSYKDLFEKCHYCNREFSR